ncbi:MAG: tetratricopeptide repeat protein [Planctomycetes bacterium]|nr:tetratricopeptide repeat protein [Planctomycetota bacterium]
MADEFAVIPFALQKDDPKLYALAAGLSMEVAAYLRECGVDVAIAAPGEQDEDSADVKLIAIAEEMDTQQVIEYVEMVAGENEVNKAVSGAIEIIDDDFESAGFILRLRAVNIAGGFELYSGQCKITPSTYKAEFSSCLKDIASVCQLESTDWQPSSDNFKAWVMAMQLSAYATLAGLHALKTEPSQVYELALTAAKLDSKQTRIREHLVDFIRHTELERQTDPKTAATTLETVCGKITPDWDSLFCYGILMMNASEPARAAKTFSLLLDDKFPPEGENKKADAAMMAGIAFNAAERWQEAQRALSVAMKDEENRVDAIVESAKSSAGLGEWTVAERLWQRAVELDPQNEDGWMNLATRAMDYGEIEKALKIFKKVSKLEEPSREAMATIADVFLQIGDLSDAVEVAKRFAEDLPGDALANIVLATAYNKNGRHKLALKSLEKAELCHGVAEFEPIIVRQRRFAKHPEIEELFKKSAANALDGDAAEAALELQGIVEKHEDFVEARYFLGVALRRDEKLSEAEQVFTQLLIDSDLPGCHKELTGICAVQGRSKEALAHAEAALEDMAGEDDPQLFTNLAAALMENDRIDEALKYAQRAEMHMPDDEFTKRVLALLKQKMSKRGLIKNLRAVMKEAWSWKRKKE